MNPHDEFWDRRLGIRTFGYMPGSGSGEGPDWQVHYTPAPYCSIFHSLKCAGLTSDDIFTDLGSGMGRVVFAASWLGVKQANGVEISLDLCESAEENRKRSRLSNRSIAFSCANARDVDLTSTTVLFIFHAFGADTLIAALRNFRRQCGPNPRVVYMNPVFNSTIEDEGWLRHCEIISPPKRLISTTQNWKVAIWHV